MIVTVLSSSLDHHDGDEGQGGVWPMARVSMEMTSDDRRLPSLLVAARRSLSAVAPRHSWPLGMTCIDVGLMANSNPTSLEYSEVSDDDDIDNVLHTSIIHRPKPASQGAS